MMQGPFKSIFVESIQALLFWALSDFFVCTEEEQNDKATDANTTNTTMNARVRERDFLFCIDEVTSLCHNRTTVWGLFHKDHGSTAYYFLHAPYFQWRTPFRSASHQLP